MEIKVLLAGLFSLGIGLAVGYPVLRLMKKLKAGQQILSYVDVHKSKSGTPTMGGVMFIVAVFVAALMLFWKNTAVVVAICAMLSYGLIGFLDDFLKIKNHHNLGLKAYQKIVAQAGIAIILSVFCYFNGNFGREIYIPFSDIVIDFGVWIIPLVFLLYVATTNAVNLLDGLDGLASKVSSVIFLSLAVMLLILSSKQDYLGNYLQARNLGGLAGLAFACFGGLIAFYALTLFLQKFLWGIQVLLHLEGCLQVF